MNYKSKKIQQLRAVIEYAKANGFPGAEAAYWNQDEPETGMLSIGDCVQECNVIYPVDIGIYLGGTVYLIAAEDDDEVTIYDANPKGGKQ